jgi:hypothetical protein
MGGIKIPNFYASPLYNNQKLTGENTSEIKKDKKGEYSLVDAKRSPGDDLKIGDTIRPANNKFFKPDFLNQLL